jgi:Phosphate transporter family
VDTGGNGHANPDDHAHHRRQENEQNREFPAAQEKRLESSEGHSRAAIPSAMGRAEPPVDSLWSPVLGMIKNYDVPYWVIICRPPREGRRATAGGWRIIKTLGQRITNLTPFGGFAAETAGAITLLDAAHFGIPVSTTHTIAGAVVGVGASRRLTAVRWGVTRRIVWA